MALKFKPRYSNQISSMHYVQKVLPKAKGRGWGTCIIFQSAGISGFHRFSKMVLESLVEYMVLLKSTQGNGKHWICFVRSPLPFFGSSKAQLFQVKWHVKSIFALLSLNGYNVAAAQSMLGRGRVPGDVQWPSTASILTRTCCCWG